MDLSSQLHALTVLTLAQVTLASINRDRMGPRTIMDTSEKRKYFEICWNHSKFSRLSDQ